MAVSANNPMVNSSVEEIDDTVHVMLRLGAKANRSDKFTWSLEDRIRAFHVVMKISDADWPFALAHFDCDNDGTYTVNEMCQHCGGVIYNAPMISPAEIIALADQFGLSIIKMKYMRETDCVVIQDIKFDENANKAVTAPTTMGELVSNILDKREAEMTDADKTEAQLIEEILNSPAEGDESEEAKADIKAIAAPSGYGFAAIADHERNKPVPSWESSLDAPSWENAQHLY